MAYWVEVLAAQSEDLSSIPGADIKMEGGDQLYKVVC